VSLRGAGRLGSLRGLDSPVDSLESPRGTSVEVSGPSAPTTFGIAGQQTFVPRYALGPWVSRWNYDEPHLNNSMYLKGFRLSRTLAPLSPTALRLISFMV
jgi:hypothetical protein